MQTLLTDDEIASASSTPSRRSSIIPEFLSTSSFSPNVPASSLRSAEVSISAIINDTLRLSTDGQDETKIDVDDMDLAPDIDLSEPISVLLRIGTQRAHIKAENSEGAAALVRGRLGVEEYVRWLAVLWRIYSALELGLAEHASHPVLAPTYDPDMLARAPRLASDITYFLSVLPAQSRIFRKSPVPPPETPSGTSQPLPPFALPLFLEPVFSHAPPPLKAYLDHLRYLASSADRAPSLLAHAYVRYLGDLSGGQIIGARIKKAYNLDGSDGMLFYLFGDEGSESASESRKRLAEVKALYRRGMDEGVGNDQKLKAHLVKEANLAFQLNTHLFSLIRPTASQAIQTLLPGQIDLKGTHQRYYERLQLERDAKHARKMIEDKIPNTWPQRIERFSLFLITAAIGAVMSQWVAPWVQATGWPWLESVVWPWLDRVVWPWVDRVVWPVARKVLRSKMMM